MKLVNYADMVKNNNNKLEKKYKCNCCNKNKSGEIWLEYKDNIKLCCYSCSKKYFEYRSFRLKDVINYKDFDFPRPVTKFVKKNKFRILSQKEIDGLNNYEYKKYYVDLIEYEGLYPERARLQMKIQQNSDYIDNFV